MKVKHFFGLAVLAAMTASCSSNDELVNNGGGTGANEATESYATFSINLPTVTGTRAADTGGAEMNGGTNNEYEVKDATALIFKKAGASENSYVFVESVDLSTMDWKNDDTEGVTTQAKVVAKLKGVSDDGNYYALVLLNNKTTDNGYKVALPTNGTYGTWNNAAKDNVDFTDNGFFMANAPLLTGSATTPTTLVNIAKGKIYASKKAAEDATDNTVVYVERGVAKVDVSTPGTDGTVKVKYNGAENEDEVKFSAWTLDVTNKKTYAVHRFDGLNDGNNYTGIWSKDRFKGTNGRIYWGIDPNYADNDLAAITSGTDDKRNQEFNYITNDKVTNAFSTADAVKPLYCLENTFNLNNMTQGQTTRVVFKSVYTPKGMNGGDTFYKVGKMETLLKADDLKQIINKAAGEVLADCTLKDDAALLTTGGVHLLTYADLKVGPDDLDGTDDKKYNSASQSGKDVAAAINAKLGLEDSKRAEDKVGINTYKEGVTYYIARIKHFGDGTGMTPWNPGEPTYGSENEKYLGRYGVLRNNWYNLAINSVSGPGYPDVPTPDPDMPDDENEKYISVSVKILDWAKRSQTVDL